MKKSAMLISAMLILAAAVARAQAPAPPDTSSTKPAETTQPAPPPAPAAAPAPAPATPPPAAATAQPQVYRYGSISGSWLLPSGDFDKIANGGWAITLEGYQFISPEKKIAIGSQVGYQSFGEKNGVTVSNFPVDALLRFYPKPGKGRTDIYVTGGLGFNYQRTEVHNVSNSDYFFGTQAGVGADLHMKGALGFVADATYHWIFATGSDTDFIALRLGLEVPMMR